MNNAIWSIGSGAGSKGTTAVLRLHGQHLRRRISRQNVRKTRPGRRRLGAGRRARHGSRSEKNRGKRRQPAGDGRIDAPGEARGEPWNGNDSVLRHRRRRASGLAGQDVAARDHRQRPQMRSSRLRRVDFTASACKGARSGATLRAMHKVSPRMLVAAAAISAVCGPVAAAPNEDPPVISRRDGGENYIEIPGVGRIPMPPGAKVFQPRGDQRFSGDDDETAPVAPKPGSAAGAKVARASARGGTGGFAGTAQKRRRRAGGGGHWRQNPRPFRQRRLPKPSLC